jgi:hypothetical protein
MWRRVALLLISVLIGLGVGTVGYHFTTDQAWFLAIPLAVALAWFTVADPTKCL